MQRENKISLMDDNHGHMVEEPMLAQPVSTYTDVMTYLHSIHISREDKERVAKRLTFEVTQPAIAKAYETIEKLSFLKKGWDGEDALPISYKVLKNIKDLLLISDNSDWENWTISPDGNATLGLQSKGNRALVSLGALEFSYFVKKNGRKYGESHVAFSPEVMLSVMREIG